MIVGPIQAQMDDFCDLHGTPDTPVSKIVTVNVNIAKNLLKCSNDQNIVSTLVLKQHFSTYLK